jgi:hypothetical protein
VKIANAGHTTKSSHPSAITIQTESETGMPTPDPFSVTTECSSDPLEPSGTGVSKTKTFCKAAVKFEPTEAVSYTGALTIFDNLEPSGKQTISLTGKGSSRNKRRRRSAQVGSPISKGSFNQGVS